MLWSQPIQDHARVFNRLIGRDHFLLVRKMLEHGFDSRVEGRPVQAVFEIMASEHFQGFFKFLLIPFPDRQAQQPLHPISDKPEDLFNRTLRQSQLIQREIDGMGDVPFGLDQRSVQVKDQEVHRRLCH